MKLKHIWPLPLLICRAGFIIATRVGVCVWWGTWGEFQEALHLKHEDL